jgi:Asp-tRNA(Asn)/Glu-tRNA(Gln) amidotransferase A subunit family amidase
MTRTVMDAALMMRELAKPDPRDTMSLPPADIPWLDLGIEVRGLRIGLMMEAGLGIELEADTRAAIQDAARAFERAGAVVEPMKPFITRAMLDGLDIFWRARAWADIGSLSEEAQDSVLPYIRVWAESGRDLTGAQVYHGMNQMMVMRHAAVAACRPYDFVISPVSPVPTYEAEFASPLDDPDAALRAHRLHGGFQHVGAAGLVGECGLHGHGPSHRLADRRPALRRPRRHAPLPRLRGVARARSGPGRCFKRFAPSGSDRGHRAGRRRGG